jgi:hypothetical protein
MRALAESAGIAPETVRRAVIGSGRASQSTLEAISRALRVDVTVVGQWVGQSREVSKRYQPPDEAHVLDEQERKAVDQVIRMLARARREGEEHGRSSTPIAKPGNVRELRPQPRRQAAQKRKGDPPDRLV